MRIVNSTEAIHEKIFLPLPKGWTRVALEFVANKITDGSHNPPAKQSLGLPMLSAKNIQDDGINFDTFRYIEEGEFRREYERANCEEGDILLTIVGTIGRTTYIKPGIQKFTIQRSVALIKPALVDFKYLSYCLKYPHFQKTLTDSAKGTAQKGVYLATLKALKIHVAPLAEQHRIVAKIEELFSDLDAGIASLKTAQAQLKIYRQAVLKWAFEGKLTAEWRKEKQQKGELKSADELLAQIKAEREKRYKEQVKDWETAVQAWEAGGKVGKKPTKPKMLKEVEPLSEEAIAELPGLPEGWLWIYLGHVFRVCVGSTPSRKEKSYWNGDINWVSSGEVAFCKIFSTKETITELGLQNSSTEIQPPGTVMLGMIGEGKTRGQSALLMTSAAHNQNTAAIRVSETECSSALLHYYFYYQYQKTREIGSGNNQKALNKERVEHLTYSLCFVEEQIQIVQEIESRLSICDSLEAAITENLQRAEALRQSILKHAFEGKLVPQDPNDEPASELLKRIQQEKKNPKQTKQLELLNLSNLEKNKT